MKPLLTALQKLCDAPDGLIASRLTARQKDALDDFARRTGAVIRKAKGAGSLYWQAKPQVVAQQLEQLSPLATAPHNLPQRAVNIGRGRSSKSAHHGHAISYLLLRAKGAVSWHNGASSLDVTHATQEQGAACLAIDSAVVDQWHTSAPLWLVENQAVFDCLDWLPDTNASILWYRGQLPDSLIDWLAAHSRAPAIVHFPDYDGVGLINYARLKERLGDAATLWLMPGWQQKLQRFGNHDIFLNTAQYLPAASKRLKPYLATDPDLKALFELLQTTGLALEQEAVWLPL